MGEISLEQNFARRGQWAVHEPRLIVTSMSHGALSHPWLETLSGSQPQVQLRRGRHWKFSCSATS